METIELYSGYGERTPEELRRDINDRVEKMTKLGLGDLYATLIVISLIVLADYFIGSLGWLRNILFVSLILFAVLAPIVWLVMKCFLSIMRQSSAKRHLLTAKRFIKCYQTINAFAECCLMGVIIADDSSEVVPVAIFMLFVFAFFTLLIWLKPYGVKWFVEGVWYVGCTKCEILADIEELDEYKLED